MEKIWSSCIYYYGLSKKLQNTYRISVCFLNDVNADIMRKALDITQKRYPYFSIKRVKSFKDIKLDKNNLPWVLKEGKEPARLGGKESNFHMIAFGFFNDTLYVDAFHGMTDGNGMMNLLRTLIYYYCKEAFDENITPQNVRLFGENVLSEEVCDPYLKLLKDEKAKAEKPAAKKTRYLNLAEENKYKPTKPYVFRLQIPQEDLMKYCGQNDGSPATAIALFLARSIKKLHKNSERVIGCGIAADLRAALKAKNSHHSSVAIPVLEFTNKIAEKPLEVQGTAFRGQVLLKCDADALYKEVCASNEFYKFINGLKIRKLKEVIMNILVKLALKGPTAAVSYVGKCNFGECEKYVKRVFSEPDAPGTGIMIEINAVNDVFCLAFIQEWEERAYFDAFCNELKNSQIAYTLISEGHIAFSNMERL